MVSFVTLIISLVAGAHPVEVAVSGPVAAVELRLDGHTVAMLRGEPWRSEVDFGPALEPHELVAVALDAGGQELGQARQLVNLPRQPVEASFLLDRDAGGSPRGGRLIVGTVAGRSPSSLHVLFDGAVVEIGEAGRIVLPAYDPARPHLLSAQIRLPDGETARTEVAFGGAGGAETRAELTAVPVVVEEGSGQPTVERLQGALRVGGAPATVLAVEKPGSRVLVVRDGRAMPFLSALAGEQERLDRVRMRSDEVLVPEELEPGQGGLRFVVPVATRSGRPELPVDLFPVSGWYRLRPGLVPWMLAHLTSAERPNQRLADAVAVAGVRAAAGGSARAVLLLMGGTPEDASRQPAEAVRRYLQHLRVPLRVWSTDEKALAPAGWGEAEDASSRSKLRRAAERLEEYLGRQWVVWVDGRHLPAAISLAEGTRGLHLAE